MSESAIQVKFPYVRHIFPYVRNIFPYVRHIFFLWMDYISATQYFTEKKSEIFREFFSPIFFGNRESASNLVSASENLGGGV
jgi:hypothetical protein